MKMESPLNAFPIVAFGYLFLLFPPYFQQHAKVARFATATNPRVVYFPYSSVNVGPIALRMP